MTSSFPYRLKARQIVEGAGWKRLQARQGLNCGAKCEADLPAFSGIEAVEETQSPGVVRRCGGGDQTLLNAGRLTV